MNSLTIERLEVNEILALGAEARVYTSRLLGRPVICKERVSKSYRSPDLDSKLRKERCIQEVRILNLAFQLGVPVPRVLDLDKDKWMIIMEYLEHRPLKSVLSTIDTETTFHMIGEHVARLHQSNIIHGDLTTSNILFGGNDVFFIDFGLGFISHHVEDRAVDILVLKHTLESSHSLIAEKAFSAFLNGYRPHLDNAQAVLKRLEVVENRVRYRSHSIS